MYNCPYCQKTLKYKRSLDRHIEQFHVGGQAAKAKDEDTNPPATPETPPELAHSAPVVPETINFKAPEAETEYYCVDCGHKGLKHGMPACPGCGNTLSWDGIK